MPGTQRELALLGGSLNTLQDRADFLAEDASRTLDPEERSAIQEAMQRLQPTPTGPKKLRERVGAATAAHPWIALTILLAALLIAFGIGGYIYSGAKDLSAEGKIATANTRATDAETALDIKKVYVERLIGVIQAMDGEVPPEEVPSPSELKKLLAEARSLQAEKKLKEADVLATKAIGMDAKSAEAWVLRAEVRRSLGITSWRQDLARAKALNNEAPK